LRCAESFIAQSQRHSATLTSGIERVDIFFLGSSMLRFFNDILDPGRYFLLLLTSRFLDFLSYKLLNVYIFYISLEEFVYGN
jgi:hypothetical protein